MAYIWTESSIKWLLDKCKDTFAAKAEAIKSLSISGRNITYTKANGTTGTLTTQDTTYQLATPTSDGLMSKADKKALESNRRFTKTIKIPANGWDSSGVQVISISEMTPDATVIVGGDIGCEPEYSDCEVYCSAQGHGTLTFTAVYTPSYDLYANLVIFSG